MVGTCSCLDCGVPSAEEELAVACSAGNAEEVKALLRENLSALRRRFLRDSAFHVASSGGHTRVLEVLVDAGRLRPNAHACTYCMRVLYS